MKTIYLTYIFILLLISSNSHAQFYSGGYDSLLFDGADRSSFLNNSPCGCKIKIIKQKGISYGTICYKKIGDICEFYDTFYVKEKTLIPSFITEILDGDTIKTGDFADSELDLQLDDGKRIYMGRNSSIIVSNDHCKNPMGIILHYGLLYLDLTTGDKNKTIGIKTERGEVVNKGTRYSIESVKERDNLVDIVRVYDGSVTFKKSFTSESQKVATNTAQELAKLTDDFQNGRITIEEYTKKGAEISQREADAAPKTVTVEAGFESRIIGSGNPTEPVPFDTNGDPKFKQ